MDIKKIKAIVDMIKESGIAELEITEGEDKLRVSCVSSVVAPVQPLAAAPSIHQVSIPTSLPQQTTVTHQPEENKPKQIEGETINSPMVGTFYRASSPNSNPFIQVGQEVKVGQVLCIIEAMKLMNQIEADKAGTIKEILAEDGKPVEYGQPLFVIA
ncbi:acetyl-CoA carboxylase biotin carboxyl carrier protein [Aquella oligotrophica]|uniref:Biotin carboxyl carrier protein of acetyl-CoA carboxylase n=1 Tax=Aquella oligotrophica TaxID=2067065 RepID=A0A2I7N5X7_9NEIS|nr:acetyl-CoA carboxylase biotin carboxyl carrier protein [Aquella oligotrophica]AUR51859.1 acetyl-CoA carboxylase biotin carboxyl carrier protein [Aquella oligotrophica]